MIKPKGIWFILRNWKLVAHLLLGTKHFGINNRWQEHYVSIFARHQRLSFRLIIKNYRMAKFRATACGFLTRQECRNLGWKSEI